MADSHLVSSFAFLRDVHRVAMMASILNLTSQAVELQQMYSALTAEFHTTWYRDSLNGYSDGSQAANTLALALPGLVPANLSSAVLSSLVQDIKSKGQFTTGIVSIAQLFPLLSSSGHHDLAVSLAQKTTYPSYGYEVHPSAHIHTAIHRRRLLSQPALCVPRATCPALHCPHSPSSFSSCFPAVAVH